MKKVLLVMLILLLCGCEKDNRECIKSHTELRIVFIPNSKGGLRQFIVPYNVCDEYLQKEGSNND